MPPSDAPDVADRKAAQHLLDVRRAVHQAAALEPRVALAELRGDLGQCLGRGDADAHGDARVALDGAADAMAKCVELLRGDAPQVEKRLVDGVDLGGGHQLPQRPDHAARHVAVEHEVRREGRHVVPPDKLPQLVEGLAHADAERLGLVRAGDDAAVVVREHDHGASVQFGTEDPFARGEEVVAVAESVHGRGPHRAFRFS